MRHLRLASLSDLEALLLLFPLSLSWGCHGGGSLRPEHETSRLPPAGTVWTIGNGDGLSSEATRLTLFLYQEAAPSMGSEPAVTVVSYHQGLNADFARGLPADGSDPAFTRQAWGMVLAVRREHGSSDGLDQTTWGHIKWCIEHPDDESCRPKDDH